MRKVMCASVALALLHVGFMPMQAFAESGAVNDDWEQTGKVTVIYHRQGTHRKPGINHHRGHKHGTPGHRGSHHKHRHSHADPHRDHASPRSPEPSKSQPAPGFSDAPVRTITWYQYLPGLNSHDRKSKPARRAPRPAPTKPAGPTPEQISAWSVDIATSIRLAKPVVDVQPRPSANKWNITAVGQPLWFHNPGAGHHTASGSAHGIVVSLDAQRVDTVYETGEKTIRCTHSTPRPANADPRAQSPHCGYIYQHPGNYTLRMTEVWKVGWQSGDQSGEIVTTRSSSKPLKVNELIGVLTKPGVR